MADIQEALRSVVFDEGIDADSLRLNEQYGFLELPEESIAIKGIKLLGFGAALSRDGGYQTGVEVTPLVHFSDLKQADRTIDKQGKGVGPRMYNTPQAAHGLTDLPDKFYAYTFNLDPDHLLDTRATEGGAMTRIARHGGRMVRSLAGLERVVDSIYKQYGDADTVLFTQPPRARERQGIERKAKNPDGMPAEFIIVRNAGLKLRRIGSTQRLR